MTNAYRHQPLVSIVTPTLNQGQFIEHTIRSIKAQTYPNIEHLVIDGGSTDGTLDILRRHEGTYNLRWVSEPDHGMYEAVNKGMRLANGEILAYLNSDDLYFPWTIEVVVDAFDRRPQADFVYGDVLAIDQGTGRHQVWWFPPFDLELLRQFGFLAQAAVFWRRQAFQAIGPFDESLKYVADCDYWMRGGERHHFGKVNEFLAIEREHDATLREASDGAVWTELERVRARYKQPGRTSHRRKKWFDIRNRIWFRLYWGSLFLQAMKPKGFRTGPWSHLLNSGRPRFHWTRVLVMLIPRIGGGQLERVVDPSEYWLEPSDRGF